ncbi:ferritin-like domain-containing protein [bacterium]|nr:ferritin-like domain-containing protein [bacterium]
MSDHEDRIVRYLDDCWAVEKTMAGQWSRMASEVGCDDLRVMFHERCDTKLKQAHRIEERLRELGGKPSRAESFFEQVAATIADLLRIPPVEDDRSTQYLMRGFAMQNFEMAMFESLRAFAEFTGDDKTVKMAEGLLKNEKYGAGQVWSQISRNAREHMAV